MKGVRGINLEARAEKTTKSARRGRKKKNVRKNTRRRKDAN